MFLIYDTTGEPTDIKTPTSAVLDEVLTSFARHLFKPLTICISVGNVLH